MKPDCKYDKGGRCHLHGEGAVRKWKPAYRTEKGEGGKLVKVKTRKYFWLCDVGEKGVRRQTVLSLDQIVRDDTRKIPDTKQGVVGGPV